MPWEKTDVISIRKEFVRLAEQEGSNIRLLCKRFGISSRTAYKWIRRYKENGETGLQDKSKRPKHISRQTSESTVQAILKKRDETGWGGRKIARVLQNAGLTEVPHPSTITGILKRNGKITEEEAQKHREWQRFERETPNELWQMDFKGHFATLTDRCHPLTILDDHSRFCICLQACANETIQTTQFHLTNAFRLYGLPIGILCDNGGPWGSGYPVLELSKLAVWLIRLDIQILHGRPSHPQTQGKEERFHRTLKAELLQGHSFSDLPDCQQHFDTWRNRYNLDRPHESLGFDTPSHHYQPSPRSFPDTLPAIEYAPGEMVRMVHASGTVTYHDREYKVGKGVIGQPVVLRSTEIDGVFDIYFCQYKVRQIKTLRKP